jgi:hypothetical protein
MEHRYVTINRTVHGAGPFVKTVPTSGEVGAAVKISESNLTSAMSFSFNGAGGLAIGMSNAGFHHDAVIERDPDASETFRENQRHRYTAK